jgi:hypothetical protein
MHTDKNIKKTSVFICVHPWLKKIKKILAQGRPIPYRPIRQIVQPSYQNPLKMNKISHKPSESRSRAHALTRSL